MLHTTNNGLTKSRLRKLKSFGRRVNKFRANFAVCDPQGKIMLLCPGGSFESDTEQLKREALQALVADADTYEGNVSTQERAHPISNHVLTAPLRPGVTSPGRAEAVAVALIDFGEHAEFLAQERVSHQQDVKAVWAEMLELLAEDFRSTVKAEEQIEKVGTELAQTYEELVLLHRLSTNMKVTEADVNFLQMACDSLTEIVNVEGIAILLERDIDGERKLALAAGSGLIDLDERMAGILHSRLTDELHAGAEALLDSEVDSPFEYEWPPNVRNIIAVPLYGKEKSDSRPARAVNNGDSIIGLMVAINRIDKPDFDSTDVKLFDSVAGGCAVFIENGRLFKDLKELFIGSLKALTSSIDAKDKYTRGHSQRVAFIARWIAERLTGTKCMDEEQIHKIYLAGLLHDIGKIGIDEAVLRKEGPLTKEELERIRRHPSIGAGILGAIKQMREVVPGVLCHHERVDGKGYPNGLAGDQIPLIGKIVGLADSFDAMTSKRTYREARSVEQALEEIAKGLGTQFDEEVGNAFLNSDAHQLWDIIQNGFSEIYGAQSFSEEYGTAAVGVLIK
jgi:HD-GYP domain-containing protein (c-di-GMP phosphodiesterase class II)